MKWAPLSDTMLTLMIDPQNVGSGAPMMGRTDQNGTFRIGGVESGTYRVMAGMPTRAVTGESSWAARRSAGQA